MKEMTGIQIPCILEYILLYWLFMLVYVCSLRS